MSLAIAEAWISGISGYRRLWVFGFAIAVMVIRLGVFSEVPAPIPVVHDEFSYLLGGDTFADGRITNPPSPMWQHFESFHINVRPTYQSMYPPAQAFFLAIGQKLTGIPWIGVVLSTAILCSAIYWMLLGWLPPQWAWLGGAFCVVRFGIFSYWINSYWGGSVAAIGGALVVGALPRLRKKLAASGLVVFASGLLILANSRPLEGFLFSLPISLAVVFLLVREGEWPATAKRLIPALALLLAGAAFLLYYNWRGTGNPLLMPYTVNYKTYHISKPFMFEKPNPIPVYTHQAMRAFYVYHEYVDVTRLRYWETDSLLYIARVKSAVFYVFYLWPFLFLVAPAVYAMCRDKDFRIVLIAVASMGTGLALEMWPSTPHYGAPWTGAVFLVVFYSLRHFRESHPDYGPWATRATALVIGVWMLLPIAERLRDPLYVSPSEFISSEESRRAIEHFWVPLEISRQRIRADLEKLPGKHLVIVHHPYHDVPAVDWIYNEADIDHSKIIWARDMGYLKNRELLDYYPDRQVWYVDRGDPLAKLLPYDEAITPWRLALEKFEGGSSQIQDARRGPVIQQGAATGSRLNPVSTSRHGLLLSQQTQTAAAYR